MHHHHQTLTQLALTLLLASPCMAQAADASTCAPDAIARAKPLLAFHVGEDDRISIDTQARELPSIRNPADPKQRFKVYEVWGFIYKGQYRMRFIYYASAGTGCVLMGEEVLQHARL
jgi:hypothetical protein